MTNEIAILAGILAGIGVLIAGIFFTLLGIVKELHNLAEIRRAQQQKKEATRQDGGKAIFGTFTGHNRS